MLLKTSVLLYDKKSENLGTKPEFCEVPLIVKWEEVCAIRKDLLDEGTEVPDDYPHFNNCSFLYLKSGESFSVPIPFNDLMKLYYEFHGLTDPTGSFLPSIS